MSRTTAAAGFLLALALVMPVHAANSRPNVLFLISDDLNCDLGSYGHPLVKSPNLDRLASRGVQFNQAYCQYPVCGPSRASFMTGLYPDQTLLYDNAVYIREHTPNVTTLPQMFRRVGYSAARIGKVFHYGVPGNIGTGGYDDPASWNRTINPRGRDVDEQDQIFSLVPGSFGGTLSWLAADGEDREQTDGIAAEEAVELLERYARNEKPFFLAVGLFRPHVPYVAPKKYFDMYPPEQIQVAPKVPEGYLDTLPEVVQRSLLRLPEQVNLPEHVAQQAMQAYYAAISFADAQLGLVLDALDETGLAENTIVVFTSDHGYHMGEHGYWQKPTLFENSTRVPLIIAGPGVEAKGSKTESFAELVDIYPTLAALCGVQAPGFLSGVSLVPILDDPNASVRNSAFTQAVFKLSKGSGYTVCTSRYRFTRWVEGGGPNNTELYDHESDPQELHNLARDPKYADVFKKMSALLDERIADAAEPPEGIMQNHEQFKRIGVN
jgi:arylsulfatase A-like enzyme